MKDPILFKLTVIEKLAKGDTAFTLEMLESFVESIPPLMKDMSDAINKNEIGQLSRIAHRLKPSFHYIGREDIFDSLNAIENADDVAPAIESCRKIMAEITPLVKEINEFIEALKKE